jgi:hypothetical protein
MLKKLRKEQKKWGLEINNEKTMYMVVAGQENVSRWMVTA